jgi:hypothetical protein
VVASERGRQDTAEDLCFADHAKSAPFVGALLKDEKHRKVNIADGTRAHDAKDSSSETPALALLPRSTPLEKKQDRP